MTTKEHIIIWLVAVILIALYAASQTQDHTGVAQPDSYPISSRL